MHGGLEAVGLTRDRVTESLRTLRDGPSGLSGGVLDAHAGRAGVVCNVPAEALGGVLDAHAGWAGVVCNVPAEALGGVFDTHAGRTGVVRDVPAEALGVDGHLVADPLGNVLDAHAGRTSIARNVAAEAFGGDRDPVTEALGVEADLVADVAQVLCEGPGRGVRARQRERAERQRCGAGEQCGCLHTGTREVSAADVTVGWVGRCQLSRHSGTLPRMSTERLPISVLRRRFVPGRWDVVAFVLVFAALALLAHSAYGLTRPLSHLQAERISLSPWALPGYAAQTALRMLVAMGASLLFTFTYATLAAKSRRAAAVLVPLLDILQSVPILGFSFTIVFFLSLTPGRVAGAEMAAVFLVFTSQAWNMAFSFYHSLRSIPSELDEAARAFHLGPWMRFWRLELPFAMPALIWNMMMSMSGGWFFVVAAEAISVGHTTVTLPGIGSYIARAIAERNLGAIGWAIAAMTVVILIYDQVIFRPLIASADWFRLEQEVGLTPNRSWALTMMRRSRLLGLAAGAFSGMVRFGFNRGTAPHRVRAPQASRLHDVLWYGALSLAVALLAWLTARYILAHVPPRTVLHVAGLGLLTLLRVVVLIALASVIWVPIGVYVGIRPRVAAAVQPVAQFLAAFPVNLLFPVAVSGIVYFRLDPNIWLSPLMILGTQWYILFNVIAGASSLPNELKQVGENLRVGGWLWWRRIALPAVFPFYITGAITAAGGSWNASIVSEVADWGNKHLAAQGLGAYIANATRAGNFARTVLGIVVMSLFVVIINRAFWRPLYARAERKFRMS